jgi:gluconolactonase
MFRVPRYCEGVCFDHSGHGYISWGKSITKFSLDGKHAVWAETGAPNGHKILADSTHLVCDASQHAVLRLSPEGKLLEPASQECEGKALRGPNDLSLDPANGGFYFSDPGGSSRDKPIGTIHYVDKSGVTSQLDSGLAFPNGIVLAPDGKRLLLAESQHNRILVYDVTAPGKVGPRKVFSELPKKNAAQGQIDDQPDGMCLDAAGNLYVAHYGMQQVQVLDPSGKLIRQYDGGNVTTSGRRHRRRGPAPGPERGRARPRTGREPSRSADSVCTSAPSRSCRGSSRDWTASRRRRTRRVPSR